MFENNRKPPETLEQTQTTPENSGDAGAFRASIEKGWLTPDEAMEYTGIKRSRFYRLLTAGDIPSAKVGRTRHVSRQDLDDYMESCKVGSTTGSGK